MKSLRDLASSFVIHSREREGEGEEKERERERKRE